MSIVTIIDVLSIQELFESITSFLSVTIDYFKLAQTCRFALACLHRSPNYKNLIDFNDVLNKNEIKKLYYSHKKTCGDGKYYVSDRLYTYLNDNNDNNNNVWYMRLAIASKLNHSICHSIISEHFKSISKKQITKALIKGMVHGSYDAMQTIFTESMKFCDIPYYFNLVTFNDLREDNYDIPYYIIPDYPHRDNISSFCGIIFENGYTNIIQFFFDNFEFDKKLIKELCQIIFIDYPCSKTHGLEWLHNYYTQKFQDNLFDLPYTVNIYDIIKNGLCENFMWYFVGYKLNGKSLQIFNNNVSTPEDNNDMTYGDNNDMTYGDNNDMTFGDNNDMTFGDNNDMTFGDNNDVTFGDNNDVTFGDNNDITPEDNNDMTFGDNNDMTYGDNNDKTYGANSLFVFACVRGTLEIVQLLYTLGETSDNE